VKSGLAYSLAVYGCDVKLKLKIKSSTLVKILEKQQRDFGKKSLLLD